MKSLAPPQNLIHPDRLSATTMSARRRLLRGTAVVVAATALLLALVPWASVDAAEAADDLVVISATSLTAGQAEQTYTMTVINTGTEAVDTEVAGSAPGLVSSAIPSQGTYALRVGLWRIGRLAPGASATLVLTAL
jgi:hypothetical protein